MGSDAYPGATSGLRPFGSPYFVFRVLGSDSFNLNQPKRKKMDALNQPKTAAEAFFPMETRWAFGPMLRESPAQEAGLSLPLMAPPLTPATQSSPGLGDRFYFSPSDFEQRVRGVGGKPNW